MNGSGFSRRYFFQGALLAGAVPRGGFGSVASLAALGFKSYNEKLNIAGVGMGTRGPQILIGVAPTENVVALCDVNEESAARGLKTYPKAATYTDYRQMLEKEAKNIDAVMIATPDHLHTHVALAAMQMGKHVYCEKPLTRTPWEARLLAEAASKYRVATQMGNQGFSHEGTKTACEILWSGDIGEVREVHAWTGGIYGGQPNIPETGLEAQPAPGALNWDLWLGPAAPRPYNSLMTNQWRAFLDFSTGGSLGDWLVHNLGPAHLALQLDKASPVSVECVTVEGKSPWVWPLRAHIVYEFPARANMPPVTVHAYQNMRGDFKDPEGMQEGERLFPPMNNLAEKGRSFVGSGDGTLLIADQLTVSGQPAPRGGRGTPPPGAVPGGPGRGPLPPGGPPFGPGGMAGRGGTLDPKLRAPGNGAVFVGSKGYMATTSRGEGVWLLPASRWADYRLPPQVLQRGINHQQDWVRACKGGAPGVSEFGVAAKYIEWLALGAIALQVPGKLMWDGAKMRFTNNEAANKLLRPFIRKGWEIRL
ncbi:MAG: Gfo/Idh/MocA family oxidoreductase [Bryobacterales bacterium]|nr:Gfo/Idh/MocA family oxidoreductase [Bryobacterales bacterium]